MYGEGCRYLVFQSLYSGVYRFPGCEQDTSIITQLNSRTSRIEAQRLASTSPTIVFIMTQLLAKLTSVVLVLLLHSSGINAGTALDTFGPAIANTTRYWDCCKPSCSWNDHGDFKDSKPVSNSFHFSSIVSNTVRIIEMSA